MSARSHQSTSLIALGGFAVLLTLLLAWSFRADNVIAGSFRLNDVQICEELDDDMKPLVRGASILQPGATQACLWFQYSRAREGDQLEIVWNFEENPIQRDSFRIQETRGTRAFYLMKDDGSALPSGSYEVLLVCNGREQERRSFTVTPLSGDISESDGENLD